MNVEGAVPCTAGWGRGDWVGWGSDGGVKHTEKHYLLIDNVGSGIDFQ